jgi:hypothetical protein
MASQEGIERTYTYLCQRANDQAVCVDMKLSGNIEVISQNSAILVLLQEYGRFYKHRDICDVWLCEGVIYHTPGGIFSLMTTYDSPIYTHKDHD